MGKLRKYTNKIEAFLHSDAGQYFFNIAYSVGAAIVIWGALFKILHLPGGNTLLCIGMGTEIAMFILTAFDRPPKEPNWEEIVPALKGEKSEGESTTAGASGIVGGAGVVVAGGGSGVILAGGGNLSGEATPETMGSLTIVDGNGADITQQTEMLAKATEELNKVSTLTEATNKFVEAIEGISRQMSELHDSMESGSSGYANQMEELNRNLAGLNTIYEIQLKNISGQLEAIDRVNKGLKDIRDMYEKSAVESAQYCEETEKMTRYMKQINAVYAKMITAMTINMGAPINPMATMDSNPFSAVSED